MSCVEPWIGLHELSDASPFSLAHVRWIRETEETDEDGELSIIGVRMMDVVGEQHRLPSIAAACHAITESNAFLPPLFWLVPDDRNEYDANAVAAYAIVKACAVHVGFLPRSSAVHFRESMKAIGRNGQALEVRGCITRSKTGPHPNVRLNLPWAFAELVLTGFADDPANTPTWLSDPAPVVKRPHRGRWGASFSDAELCKIYCWYGHQNGWFLLPDAVEEAASGFRASGLGSLHQVVPLFEESVAEAVQMGPEWAAFNHNSEAKAFARKIIRDRLGEDMSAEDVKAEFKGTSVRGRLQDMAMQLYAIEWVRLGDETEILCTMTIQKVGDDPEDYDVRTIEFAS